MLNCESFYPSCEKLGNINNIPIYFHSEHEKDRITISRKSTKVKDINFMVGSSKEMIDYINFYRRLDKKFNRKYILENLEI